MSLALHLALLRNNMWTSYSLRQLKQHAGFLSGKLFDPRRYEKRHFTTRVQTLETKFTRAPSWSKSNSGSYIPGIQSLWPKQTSELDQPGTVIVFDIETTGFFHRDHKIIEIALRDLSGGKNCTFETLINPEQEIPTHIAKVTRIGNDMVCRPDVPRFSDLIPVLLAYIRSRQVPGKPVMWVAHNAKQFDVPFLALEFQRCSAEIPADWIFVDSLSLARKLVKSEVKVKVKVPGEKEKKRLINLEALRKHYGIRPEGSAHRAMRDVTVLCQIIQKITFDLKLTYEGLRNESIGVSACRKLPEF